MVVIAQQLIKHHADGEQIGRDIPPGQVDIRCLIRRRTLLRVHGIAHTGSDVEIQELRADAGKNALPSFLRKHLGPSRNRKGPLTW